MAQATDIDIEHRQLVLDRGIITHYAMKREYSNILVAAFAPELCAKVAQQLAARVLAAVEAGR